MFRSIVKFRIAACCLVVTSASAQDQPIDWTWDNVRRPAGNTDQEPMAAEFSLAKSLSFLDQAALNWTKHRKCFTCHTNYAYLMARPMAGAESIAHRQVRAELESLVNERWKTEGPRWDAEVVMSAAVLAINDSLTDGKLSSSARTALDRIWTVQRDDGGFDWLKCGWPPMEIDDDYGIAIAAIAAAVAPEEYAKTYAAVQGMNRLRRYLEANPPPTLHHRAMLLWADSYGSQMLSDHQRSRTIDDLRQLQKSDGGWASATLADWKRKNGDPQDTETSDAYGTAFATFILQRAGATRDDPAVVQGINWLQQHQRESGRWFSRSLYKDSTHFLSHAATAMAVMAIKSSEH